MASEHKLDVNRWSRIRDDMDQLKRYDMQSAAPFDHKLSFGLQNGCDPMFSDFFQCRAYAPGGDRADINNVLRFGEDFRTYEPGHAVSTELAGRSPFLARGSGSIDVDSSLRADMSNADIIRQRKSVEELDLVGFKLPPANGIAAGECGSYSVIADNGTNVPRGGDPTRVYVRNAEKYVRR